jgi:uncharacterized protein (TIGR02001 family)
MSLFAPRPRASCLRAILSSTPFAVVPSKGGGTGAVRALWNHRRGAQDAASWPGCAPRWGARGPAATARKLQKDRLNPLEKDVHMNKRSLVALAAVAAAAIAPAAAQAQVAYNVGLFSDYRYRGISQSRLKPALQGGVDYTAGAFYVGAWGSTIKWVKDAGGDANVEIDIYGGYKGEFTKGFGYDAGVLTYVYPKNKLSTSANTTEIYGALTYGPATLKYSHVVSKGLFGAPDSKNGYYLDLSAGFELTDGWMLTPHVGHQRYKGPFSGIASYWDYSLTASKDFKGLVPSLAVVGNSKAKDAYYTTANGKNLAKTTVVLGVKYNF